MDALVAIKLCVPVWSPCSAPPRSFASGMNTCTLNDWTHSNEEDQIYVLRALEVMASIGREPMAICYRRQACR